MKLVRINFIKKFEKKKSITSNTRNYYKITNIFRKFYDN